VGRTGRGPADPERQPAATGGQAADPTAGLEAGRRIVETRLIAIDELPITSRMLGVDLDGSRRIEPARVGWVGGPDGSRRIQTDRLDDQMDDQGPSDRNRMPKQAASGDLTLCAAAVR
jgi:hypothetical protein